MVCCWEELEEKTTSNIRTSAAVHGRKDGSGEPMNGAFGGMEELIVNLPPFCSRSDIIELLSVVFKA